MLAVVGDLGGTDAVARFQIVGAQTGGGRLLGGGEDDGGAVDVVGAQGPDGALADGVVGNDGEEGGVDAQVCQRQGDVGLAAAVGCLERIGHADLLVVRGTQAEHDLADGDELQVALQVAEQRMLMLHGTASSILMEHLFHNGGCGRFH